MLINFFYHIAAHGFRGEENLPIGVPYLIYELVIRSHPSLVVRGVALSRKPKPLVVDCRYRVGNHVRDHKVLFPLPAPLPDQEFSNDDFGIALSDLPWSPCLYNEEKEEDWRRSTTPPANPKKTKKSFPQLIQKKISVIFFCFWLLFFIIFSNLFPST